jgi:predicted solute-binding protein
LEIHLRHVLAAVLHLFGQWAQHLGAPLPLALVAVAAAVVLQ